MTSKYAELTERVVNNLQTKFMELSAVKMENKKYVSLLKFNGDDDTLTLQLPVCQTKAGIVEQTSKTYVDLLFDTETDGVKELVDLLIAMEEESAKQLHAHSGEWFEGDTESMSVQSFEDMFVPVVRYVNRQRNVCIRVNIPLPSNAKSVSSSQLNDRIYDCDLYDKDGRRRGLSDIRVDTQILPLVEVKEIRMTTTSVAMHLEMVECMIVKDSESLVENEEPAPVRRIKVGGSPITPSTPVSNVAKEECDDGSGDAGVGNTVVDVDVDVGVASELEQSDKLGEGVSEGVSEGVDVVLDVDVDVCDACEDEDDSAMEGGLGNDGRDTSGGPSANEGDDAAVGDEEVKDVTGVFDDGLVEVGTFDIDEAEPMKLRKPDDVYKDIYKAAIAKAKKLRQVALEAYLDAKKIKAKFMLEDVYDTDDDGNEEEDDAEMEEVSKLSVNSG